MRTLTIMAGGGGVRFWPQSRKARPKQFLSLDGQSSLLQEAAGRALPLFGWEGIAVVTGTEQGSLTREQLPELPTANLFLEPAARNTAACLALSAALWLKRDPQAVMLVTPADHLIAPDEAFRLCVTRALDAVEAAPETVALLGVVPTRAATGYGYIEVLQPVSDLRTSASGFPLPREEGLRVRAFREKPDEATATQFVRGGQHLWNTGIFVWRADRFLALLDRYQPSIASTARHLANRNESPWTDSDRAAFAALPSISVDHAVLEPLSREPNSNLVVFPADFTWSDVGSWQAWPDLWGRDAKGNTVRGKHIGLETANCTIQGRTDHLIATFGIKGLLIVQTPGATLIARRDDDQAIRQLVKAIEEQGGAAWL